MLELLGCLRTCLLQEEILPAEGTADQIISPSTLKHSQKPMPRRVSSLLPGQVMFQATLPELLTDLLLVGLIVEGWVCTRTAKEIHSNRETAENSLLALLK